MKVLRLFTDGAARGNPGHAGIGISIEDADGMKLKALHLYVGHKTNNQAEYLALIEGLKAVRAWNPDRLEVRLDSKLVVEQMKGAYRVKEPQLKELHERAMGLAAGFADIDFKHVEREQNKRADYLANMAIDEHVPKEKSGKGHVPRQH